uniref:fibronectin type III domain-containing protein n=1 Tax=Paenibacillus alkalitolerans TaxID=2799335 RepID=UPI002D7E9C58|nr:fibronectin type III domain-containing protein [Paenibacillus alkalitolerans]
MPEQPPVQAPTWPQGSTLTANEVTQTSLKLTWTPASDANGVTEYRIYKGDMLLDTVTGATYEYNVTGLVANTNYTFKVEAGNAADKWTTDGPAVTVATEAEEPPIQAPTWPQGSTLTATDVTQTDLKLTWTPASDANGVTEYRIYKGDMLLDTVTGATYEYNVTGLVANTNYTFKVEAGNAADKWTTDGPAVTVATEAEEPPIQAPTWPQGSTLTATDVTQTDLKLTWTPASDANGVTEYRIYKGDMLLDTVTGATYEYNVTGLVANTNYTFKVEAGNAADKWTTDGPAVTVATEAEEPPIQAPTWPQGSTLTATDVTQTDLKLTWTPASDANGVTEYRIYKGDMLLDTVTGATYEYDVTGLVANTNYTFKVEAGNAAGKWTTNGPTVNVTTEAEEPSAQAPSWPTGSTLSATDITKNSLKLSWTQAVDAVGVTGYRIYNGNTLLTTVTGRTFSYNVTGLNARTAYTFKVEAGNAAGKWTTNGPSVTATTYSNGSRSPTGFFIPPKLVEEADNGARLTSEALTVKQITKSGIAMSLVTVNESALAQAFDMIKGKGADSQVITLNAGSASASVELPAAALLKGKQSAPNAVISIQAGNATYNLPLSVLDIEALAAELNVKPEDLKITVTIHPVSEQNGNFDSLSEWISFTVHAEAGDKSVELEHFGSTYITRTITVNGNIDSNEATAVALNENMEPVFVPSVFAYANGVTTITIKRNSNSVYGVIKSKKMFDDLNGHWAKSDIELLASKLVIKGMTDNKFASNDSITRAQFAALLVRSLGLAEEPAGTEAFTDVSASDWFAGTVAAAVKAGLIEGHDDGTFKPNDSVTREQMAVMMSRAIKAAGKKVDAANKESTLAKYSDKEAISAWAQNEVAALTDARLLQGIGDSFVPKDNATRAQAATIIKRLLQYVEFIN